MHPQLGQHGGLAWFFGRPLPEYFLLHRRDARRWTYPAAMRETAFMVRACLATSFVIGFAALSLARADEPNAGDNRVAPLETFSSDQRAHWAYQIPKRQELPAVKDATWVKNPIDGFILA